MHERIQLSVAQLYVVHTDGADKVMEESVGEERLRQLPEVHLQSSSGHMDVLPLPVHQVHLLIWTHTNPSVSAIDGHLEQLT